MATGWMRNSWILGLFAWGMLAACPDPEARFEEFVEDTEGFREPPEGLGESTLSDLEGRFLLSASVEISPAAPLFFDLRIETNYGDAEECPAGGCTLDMEILPLVSPDVVGCGEPFTPAAIAIGTGLSDEARQNPQPIEVRDIPVNADGSFIALLPKVTVEGCANAISGSEIVAELALNAIAMSDDRFCGLLQGAVIEPLQAALTRSTFGAERIDGDPADIDPVPILVGCPAEEDDDEGDDQGDDEDDDGENGGDDDELA